MGGVPPSRAVRIFSTGVLGATQTKGGRTRLSEFADAVNAYTINDASPSKHFLAIGSLQLRRSPHCTQFATLHTAGYRQRVTLKNELGMRKLWNGTFNQFLGLS